MFTLFKLGPVQVIDVFSRLLGVLRRPESAVTVIIAHRISSLYFFYILCEVAPPYNPPSNALFVPVSSVNLYYVLWHSLLVLGAL